jgi:hypothetical protein
MTAPATAPPAPPIAAPFRTSRVLCAWAGAENAIATAMATAPAEADLVLNMAFYPLSADIVRSTDGGRSLFH